MIKQSLLDAFGKTINTYISLDPEAGKQLEKLEGKRFTFELQGIGICLHGHFEQHKIAFISEHEETPDVFLRGSAFALFAAARNREKRQQLFKTELHIEGDAEVAQLIAHLFDSLEIDWEEQFAKLAGDVPAYHLGKLFRQATSFLHKANESLTANISEYIHEEAEWLPTREALDDFFNDIDVLRMDVDRAEATIRQLEAELANDEASE